MSQTVSLRVRIANSIKTQWSSRDTSLFLCIACLAIVTVLLCWRRPDALVNPQFWAEDGSTLFSEAYFYGARSLLRQHAGYYHLLARLAALAGRLIPLPYVPHWYYLASWGLVALLIGYLFLPRIPLTNGLRFLLGLSLVANTADNEVFWNLSNFPFLLAPVLILLAIAQEPRNRQQAAFDMVIMLVTGLSSAFAVCLWPLFLLRWGLRRTRFSLYLALLSVAIAVLQLRHMPTRLGDQGILPAFSPLFVDAAIYRIGYMLLGEQIYRVPLTASLRLGGSALALGLLVYIAWRAIRGKNWTHLTVMLGGMLATALSAFVFRHNPAALIHNTGRHFYVPAVIFAWALLLGKPKLPQPEHILAAATLIAFLFLTPGSKGQTLADLDWPGTIARCTEVGRMYRIPINPVWNPPAWYAAIYRRAYTPPAMQTTFHATFGSQIELLGYDLVQEEGQVRLKLVWRAVETMRQNYGRLVQLRDTRTPAVAWVQQEGAPLDGYYHTDFWVANEIVTDYITLPLTAADRGTYQIALSWYPQDSPQTSRLPAYDDQATRWNQDCVILPTTVVVP